MKPATLPATLDHAGIAARIPHSGSMCLLDTLQSWSADTIRCTALGHRDAAHPLRSAGTLPAPVAIEYAAQAMALHGTLCAEPGAAPRPGFLASVRGVRLLVPRLDAVEGALVVTAQRLAGDSGQALYSFTLHDERATLLVDGRATVILNALP
ncbi:MAG: hydroxymyristoyl-ACP dehydratase [Rubrivivax sp.]|nr:hydroxymyristoyl-ACP dehydratase [Rubrivivax sp.]